jgi:hypothetical protein
MKGNDFPALPGAGESRKSTDVSPTPGAGASSVPTTAQSGGGGGGGGGAGVTVGGAVPAPAANHSEAGPWESGRYESAIQSSVVHDCEATSLNRFLDVVKGTAKMKVTNSSSSSTARKDSETDSSESFVGGVATHPSGDNTTSAAKLNSHKRDHFAEAVVDSSHGASTTSQSALSITPRPDSPASSVPQTSAHEKVNSSSQSHATK